MHAHVKVGDLKFLCISLKLKIRSDISTKVLVEIIDTHFIMSVEKVFQLVCTCRLQAGRQAGRVQ